MPLRAPLLEPDERGRSLLAAAGPIAGGDIACAALKEGASTVVSRLDPKGTTRWTYTVRNSIYGPAATNADRSRVVVANKQSLMLVASDGTAKVIDTPGLGPDGFETALAVSPSGRHVLTGLSDGTLLLWELP